MPNPPTKPQCTMHQQFLPLPNVRIPQYTFCHTKIHWLNSLTSCCSMVENVVLEHTCNLTWMVIATWPHLHVSSPIYNYHGFHLTCVNRVMLRWLIVSTGSVFWAPQSYYIVYGVYCHMCNNVAYPIWRRTLGYIMIYNFTISVTSWHLASSMLASILRWVYSIPM